MSIRNEIESGYYATYSDFGLYNCLLCDGVNQAIYCDDCETDHCQICFEAYGCDGCE